MKVIEQDTINFIKAHINERPRYKLAQRMGVSVNSCIRFYMIAIVKSNIKDLFRNPTRNVMNKSQNYILTIRSERLQ